MEFLKKTTAGLPNWAWGLVVVAGLGIGYLIISHQNQANATSQQTQDAASAVQTPAANTGAFTASGTGAGEPQIVLLPLANAAPTPTDTSTPAPTPSIPPGTPRGRTTTTTMITIRQKGGSSVPSVQSYDKNNPPGVPVRATPGGVQVRFQSYGSTVATTGPAINGGPSNVKEGVSGGGSLTWYPVEGGFISAFDVSGVSQQSVQVAST